MTLPKVVWGTRLLSRWNHLSLFLLLTEHVHQETSRKVSSTEQEVVSCRIMSISILHVLYYLNRLLSNSYCKCKYQYINWHATLILTFLYVFVLRGWRYIIRHINTEKCRNNVGISWHFTWQHVCILFIKYIYKLKLLYNNL